MMKEVMQSVQLQYYIGFAQEYALNQRLAHQKDQWLREQYQLTPAQVQF